MSDRDPTFEVESGTCHGIGRDGRNVTPYDSWPDTRCVDVAGTALVFATTTGAFRADRRCQALVCGRAATPGFWQPYACINGGEGRTGCMSSSLPR